MTRPADTNDREKAPSVRFQESSGCPHCGSDDVSMVSAEQSQELHFLVEHMTCHECGEDYDVS